MLRHGRHHLDWHFAITLITVSVLITWMQNGASGSLVPAFLCHALVNLSGEVLPLWAPDGSGGGNASAWVFANGLLIVCTAIVVRVAGAQRLTRRREPKAGSVG